MRRLVFLNATLALCGLANAMLGAPLKVACKLDFIPDPNKPGQSRTIIRVGITDGESGKPLYHLIRSDSPAASTASRFKVLFEGKEGEPLSVQIIPRAPQDNFPGLQSDILLGSAELDASKGYSVQLLQGSGDPPGIEVKGFAPIAKFGPVNIGSAPRNVEFLNRNKAVQRKFSILGGENGTSASLKLTYGIDSLANASATDDPMNDRRYRRFSRFQAMLDADLSYHPDKNNNYINSINAEADYVLVQFFESKNFGDLRGLFETGLAGRFEADQQFDKINLTVGWTNWLSVNSPGLSKFATGLCLLGKPEANVPPILVFSYDYVSSIKDDLPANNRGEDTGRNRLRGRFYWSIQLAHDADLFLVKHYNADLLIDVGGAYDFDSGKAFPDVRLSLDIGPQTASDTAPKFTLSFVNGKTTPTFRNYNALLAGFKQPF
ncbi:MAG: hypothetical protein DLM73_09305 [Chthoniobacterales bacterium]|nr:MAG: hypothetical protein DLM73_09305 [Chthoniobacterales bacterium]